MIWIAVTAWLCYSLLIGVFYIGWKRLHTPAEKNASLKVGVSVVVAMRNEAPQVETFLHSVAAQQYEPFELIVVDNYSEYDFYGLMESFHTDKIRAFQNMNNGIIAVNRNFGIEKARGDYIAFCDDDDLWVPEKLQKQMEYMIYHDADIISTGLIYFGDGIKESINSRLYKNKCELFLKNKIAPSTVLAKKVPELRFNCNPDFNCAEDWAMIIELILVGYKLHQLPDALVYYRMSKSSSTTRNVIHPNRKAIWILKYYRKKYREKFSLKYFLLAVTYHRFAFFAKWIRLHVS